MSSAVGGGVVWAEKRTIVAIPSNARRMQFSLLGQMAAGSYVGETRRLAGGCFRSVNGRGVRRWPAMRIAVSSIRTDELGFAAIARIHVEIEQEREPEVFIDCGRLEWLDANMCAPLAAAIVAADRPIRLQNLRPKIGTILQKNGFVPGAVEDTHGTTIRYRRFDAVEEIKFAAYVE